MKTRTLSIIMLLTVVPAFSACTIRATLKQTTDTTSNISASTSGKSWFTSEGLVRQDQKVTAFAHLNFDNLQQDMARGHGENLASFGTLLGIPDSQQSLFSANAQERFTALGQSDSTNPDELIAAVSQTLAVQAVSLTRAGQP